MLQIATIRNQTEAIIQGLQNRNIGDAEALVHQVLKLDQDRRGALSRLEVLRQEMNQSAKSIGALIGQGKKEEAEAVKAHTATLKGDIKQLEEAVSAAESARHEVLTALPNICHPSVPVGKSETDNRVISEHGTHPSFDFSPRTHWELVAELGVVDFELGAKVTGAGFPVYLGQGARLQRALITWFLDKATAAGYLEVMPPLMVNEASGFGTGQLPDKEGQMYHIGLDDLYLIPTAEVPITNLFRDVILTEEQLPVKRCGYTPCFRREAGSYGAHVRGLNRLHQFDKVELVHIAHPDRSYEVLEEMTAHVCGLLDQLQLPYRKLLLCTGDTGFTSAKTYDLEVYSAAQERWLEVSSVSNFETYQANRLKLRFRSADKKSRLAHTLNGSALALPRIVAAIIEDYQQADGSVRVPEVLRPYTGFERIGG